MAIHTDAQGNRDFAIPWERDEVAPSQGAGKPPLTDAQRDAIVAEWNARRVNVDLPRQNKRAAASIQSVEANQALVNARAAQLQTNHFRAMAERQLLEEGEIV